MDGRTLSSFVPNIEITFEIFIQISRILVEIAMVRVAALRGISFPSDNVFLLVFTCHVEESVNESFSASTSRIGDVGDRDLACYRRSLVDILDSHMQSKTERRRACSSGTAEGLRVEGISEKRFAGS